MGRDWGREFESMFQQHGRGHGGWSGGPGGRGGRWQWDPSNRRSGPPPWLTGLFGLGFLGLELYEFAHLIHEGAVPQRSAFLSAFFVLVGTHGLHVFFGCIWLVVLMVQVGRTGLIAENRRRLMCLSMFWHFLDVVWIGVFTFVYLMGVLK